MKTKLSKQEILERVGTMAQLAGIRPYVLREGRKNGVSAADLWNGSGLSMTVLSDRASDIYSVTYQGRSLCWLSGVGASGPWFAHNGPFEWDKNFGGGMLATCGLTTAGLPSADAGETLNLHGDIANLPAEEVNCRTFHRYEDLCLGHPGRRRRSARRHGGRPGGRRHRDLFRGLYQLRLPRCHFVCRADPSASHQAQRTVWQQTDQ